MDKDPGTKSSQISLITATFIVIANMIGTGVFTILPLKGNLVPANYSNIFCPTGGVQSSPVKTEMVIEKN